MNKGHHDHRMTSKSFKLGTQGAAGVSLSRRQLSSGLKNEEEFDSGWKNGEAGEGIPGRGKSICKGTAI